MDTCIRCTQLCLSFRTARKEVDDDGDDDEKDVGQSGEYCLRPFTRVECRAICHLIDFLVLLRHRFALSGSWICRRGGDC